MGFIYPWMLWGLVGLVPLVIAWSLLRARRDVLMERFAVRETWPVLNRTVSQNARFHKGVILLLALIFSIVAAARPYWGAREREVQARGVNVIFAVDVSRSMAATDILPDRLTSAKRVVRQVLPELPGNRVGLIPFAGEAFLQCPLTTDYSIIQDVLQRLDFDAVSYQGTSIPEVITTAANAFERSGSGNRALVILTDGEDHSEEIVKAAQKAAELNIRIYALGIGTAEGAPLRMKDGSFKEDQAGIKVLSRLNEQVLRDLADKTGGRAYIAGDNGVLDPTPLIADLQGLSKDDLGVSKRVVREERFQWPLGLAVLCLLIEPLIRERRSSSIRKQSKAPRPGTA